MVPAHQNPFRTSWIDALPFHFEQQNLSQVWGRFHSLRWRGVLVGPHGSGKTTLRETLERRLRAEGWNVHQIILTDTETPTWSLLHGHIQSCDPKTIVSLDGLDRLGSFLWWRLQRATQHCGGLLATSHVTGRLPLLYQHATSPELLKHLVCLLLTDQATMPDHEYQRLFDRHHGNIRNCLRELYDIWPTLMAVKNEDVATTSNPEVRTPTQQLPTMAACPRYDSSIASV